MLAYATVGVRDFEAALVFYDALLGALGHVRTGTFPEDGWAGWGREAGGRGHFYISRPFDGQPASVGNGSMTAFAAEIRTQVQAAHTVGLAAGGTDEGAPGPRPHYGVDFYGAYLRDPEGNKLAIVLR